MNWVRPKLYHPIIIYWTSHVHMWLVVGLRMTKCVFCVLCIFVFFYIWSQVVCPCLCFTCFCVFLAFSSSVAEFTFHLVRGILWLWVFLFGIFNFVMCFMCFRVFPLFFISMSLLVFCVFLCFCVYVFYCWIHVASSTVSVFFVFLCFFSSFLQNLSGTDRHCTGQ